jgi:hypothetical protein
MQEPLPMFGGAGILRNCKVKDRRACFQHNPIAGAAKRVFEQANGRFQSHAASLLPEENPDLRPTNMPIR